MAVNTGSLAVFARCSPAMEDGKRYENMAWRLWSRETFCCQPDHLVSPEWSFERQLPAASDMPELSTSVASDDSNLDTAITSTSRSDSTSASRPDLRRHDSATSHARGKHLTPIGLEKVVNSIQEKKFLEPLSPLPPQLAAPVAPTEIPTPRPVSPPTTARRIPESSSSTVATTQGSEATSPPVGSEASTSTDISHHSVVRGFEPGNISTSVRSSANLAPTPILKTSASFIARPPPSRLDAGKKKQPMFTLGGSSDEDACSSFDSYSLQRSNLAESLRKAPPMRKTTSFKNEVSTRTYQDIASESEEAIESESEEEIDESAIEEDDSEEEWEDDDDNDESGPSSLREGGMFPRVDSKPNLQSRRSLLTTALHEGDRAQALQNAASRSTPAIRRSRTTTPNGPSTGNSPQEEGLMMRQQASRSKPIIMTTSNVHPPAMSPRTTRRLMLQSELTSSLRQNLLWERQQKNATSNAFNKRGQSAISLPALRRAATTTDVQGMNGALQQKQITSHPTGENAKQNSSYDETTWYLGNPGEYHTRGW